MFYSDPAFLTRDPFALMRRMGDQLDRAVLAPPSAQGYPAVNVWRGAEAVAVTAELPGVEAGDVDLSVKDGALTIRGERKPPERGEKAAFRRRERAFGRFSRAVRLPFPVDAENVEARLENGVLQILLRRRAEDMPRRIEVKAA